MLREMLKSKIHRAVLTGVHRDYEGSIAIDPALIDLADLREHEKVLVANVATGARFETYVIRGEPGQVALNGAAARLGAPGDLVIVMAFTWVEDGAPHAPRIVHVDAHNAPLDREKA
jgi:aspartate 1-decarboxylase